MSAYLKALAIFIFILVVFSNQAMSEEILTWDDCLAEAKNNNPDLIFAAEGIKEKKASKDITASDLYPQVTSSVDASTSMTTSTSTAGVTSSSTSDSYSYGVSGTQLIFDGLKTFIDVKSASEDLKAAKENYRFASGAVRYNLRAAFVNLLKAQELIRVAEDIVKIRRDNLILISLRYESGLEHKGALLTAEANSREAIFELAQAKRDVEFSQWQLNKNMGRLELNPIRVKGDFIVRDAAVDKPDFQEIINKNPSVLEAIANKNSAAFDVKSAYANFSPQLSGSAGAKKTNSRWPPRNDQWNLGLSLDMPIFEGGLRFAQVSRARALYNQAQANERSIKDTAIVTLQQAWVSLQDAIETVEVRSKSLEATKERAKIAEAQYSTGFINFDDWIIIENALVAAKKAHLEAQANALLAEAYWIQAKGETLEYAQ